MASDLDVVSALAGAFSAWWDEPSFPFRGDCCVNGTRVATRALRWLGVRARPLSVQFVLFNRFAWELWEAGFEPDEWPPQAWSLGVGPEGLAVSNDEMGEMRWNGHLVCEGAGWTLDISARQFHRPGRIVAPEPLVFAVNLPPTGRIVYTDEHQQRLLIGRWRDNDRWRDAPGWIRMHRREVNELVQRTKALLD